MVKLMVKEVVMKDGYPRLPCSAHTREKVKSYKRAVKTLALPGLVDELISRGFESISMPTALPTLHGNTMPLPKEASDANAKPL